MKSFDIIYSDSKGTKVYASTAPVLYRTMDNLKNGEWFKIVLSFPSG